MIGCTCAIAGRALQAADLAAKMVWMMIETAWQVGKAVPGRMARAVLDFALPPRWGIWTAAAIEHNALGARCWSKLEFI